MREMRENIDLHEYLVKDVFQFGAGGMKLWH